MFIKINNNTKIIEDYSDNIFNDLTEDQYQLNTIFNFTPSLSESYWKHIKGHVFELVDYKDKRNFLNNQYTYSELITLMNTKKLLIRLQYNELINGYRIWFIDAIKEYFCILNNDIHVNEILDFETNYKDNCNLAIDMIEEDTGLLKIKPREVEATLYLSFVYFTTGNSESLNSGNDISYTIDTSISGKTIISFSPTYNYYISGGGIKITNVTSESIIGSLVLAPDLLEEYGGNVVLINNKKIFGNTDNFTLEVSPKYVKYYSYMPIANVIEFTINHDPFANIDIEIYLMIYK